MAELHTPAIIHLIVLLLSLFKLRTLVDDANITVHLIITVLSFCGSISALGIRPWQSVKRRISQFRDMIMSASRAKTKSPGSLLTDTEISSTTSDGVSFEHDQSDQNQLQTSRSRESKSSSKKKRLVRLRYLPLFGNDKDNNNLENKSIKSPRPSNLLLRRLSDNKTLCRKDSFTTLTTSPASVDNFFMSYRFPVTKQMEQLVFRKVRRGRISNKSKEISIENIKGEIVGSVDYSTAAERCIRILKDARGRPCALIQQVLDETIFGGHTFRVYGYRPCTSGQRTSRGEDTVGWYFWGEIKNTGSPGGKFILKKKRCSTDNGSTSADHYLAKPFGSFFAKDKSKGYTIFDSEEKECVKMISLKNRSNKGIMIAPKRDMCLMLAFCAVVEEMVENLMM